MRPDEKPGLKSEHGFLLYETTTSLVIFSAVGMGLLIGFVSLEHNLVAGTDFATNHIAALRVSDYLALDLRRALSIQAAQNNTTISIPDYYDDTGTPRTPNSGANGNVFYGASSTSTVSIRYYLLGGTIYRQQGTVAAVAIADNVQSFVFDVTDLGKVVTTHITFNPTFNSAGASVAGTTATAMYNTTPLGQIWPEPFLDFA